MIIFPVYPRSLAEFQDDVACLRAGVEGHRSELGDRLLAWLEEHAGGAPEDIPKTWEAMLKEANATVDRMKAAVIEGIRTRTEPPGMRQALEALHAAREEVRARRGLPSQHGKRRA